MKASGNISNWNVLVSSAAIGTLHCVVIVRVRGCKIETETLDSFKEWENGNCVTNGAHEISQKHIFTDSYKSLQIL